MKKSVSPWVHPSMHGDVSDWNPVRINIHRQCEGQSITRWVANTSVLDTGILMVTFLVGLYPKYQVRTRGKLTDVEVKSMADNTMLLLNIKDGVA